MITIEQIKEIVAEYFGQPVELLSKVSKKREIVQSRQIAMFFSKKLTRHSLATIGEKIGNQSHMNVKASIKVANNLIETDKIFEIYINEIENKLYEYMKNPEK